MLPDFNKLVTEMGNSSYLVGFPTHGQAFLFLDFDIFGFLDFLVFNNFADSCYDGRGLRCGGGFIAEVTGIQDIVHCSSMLAVVQKLVMLGCLKNH